MFENLSKVTGFSTEKIKEHLLALNALQENGSFSQPQKIVSVPPRPGRCFIASPNLSSQCDAVVEPVSRQFSLQQQGCEAVKPILGEVVLFFYQRRRGENACSFQFKKRGETQADSSRQAPRKEELPKQVA